MRVASQDSARQDISFKIASFSTENTIFSNSNRLERQKDAYLELIDIDLMKVLTPHYSSKMSNLAHCAFPQRLAEYTAFFDERLRDRKSEKFRKIPKTVQSKQNKL